MRRAFCDLPKLTGALKVVPEDFVVEELSDGSFDGDGPHLILWIEKRGRDTREVVEALSRVLGVPRPEIGVAGQKDRQAVTRQWISVPSYCIEDPASLRGVDTGKQVIAEQQDEPSPGSIASRDTGSSGDEDGATGGLPHGDGWRALEARLHGSKLRTGRLRGNRFVIRLRGGARGAEAAREGLHRLTRLGLPNYFGPQRFGRGGQNAARGLAILRGTLEERRRFKVRMYLSALQSEMFNHWLDRRVDDGLLNCAIPGDLLRVRNLHEAPDCSPSSLCLTEDPESDSRAVAEGEMDPTGPIFGAFMRRASGEEEARESAVLEEAGLTLDELSNNERDAPGSRRPARAWVDRTHVHAEEEDLVIGFDLERGAYATVLLAQLGLTV